MDLKEAFRIADDAIKNFKNLIIIGSCSVKYFGRATSKIAEGERIIIIKEDGSFLVHQNKKLAAINYQPPKSRISCELADDVLILKAANRRTGEQLEVRLKEVKFAYAFRLKDDESIKVFATEKDLAKDLMNKLDVIEEGLKPIKEESSVLRGFIDILAEDKNGSLVVIEVKRRTATLDAVSQLKRYVEEVRKRKDKPVRGILCAPSITPNAKTYLEREGFKFSKIDYDATTQSDWIKSVENKQKALEEFF